jgi:hypothetical protein
MSVRNLTQTALALALASVAALTGCSSGGSADKTQNNTGGDTVAVFDFTAAPGPAKGGVTIKIPDSVKPRQLDGMSYCAADIQITYANGGETKLAEPYIPKWTNQANLDAAIAEVKAVPQRMATKLNVIGANQSVEQTLTQNWGKPTGGANGGAAQMLGWLAGADPTGAAEELLAEGPAQDFPSYQAIVDEVVKRMPAKATQAVQDAKKVPAKALVSYALENGSAPTRVLTEAPAAFDGTNPKAGFYLADDMKTAVVVQKCASSPYEGDTQRVWFPRMADQRVDALASAAFTLMKDGTVSVGKAEVRGYQLDSGGNWLKK